MKPETAHKLKLFAELLAAISNASPPLARASDIQRAMEAFDAYLEAKKDRDARFEWG